MTELTVGIDFGTSNSAVVLYEGAQSVPHIFQISSVEPNNVLRSVVGYRKEQLQPDIGETVRQNFVYYDDVIEEVKLQMSEGNKKIYELIVGGTKSPIEVATAIFNHMKSRLDENFGGEAKIEKAAITVPAIFDKPARLNILKAAQNGGFDVTEENLIDEPTAASESFNTHGELKDGSHYMIFDLGAGTLDLSYFEKQTARLRPIAKAGTKIGGNVFDQALFDWVIKKCRIDLSIDLKDESAGEKLFGEKSVYEQTLFEIREKCRIAKENLSTADSETTTISMRLLPGKNINFRLTRTEFEELVADKIRVLRQECESLKQTVERKEGQAKPERIYLVGGASKMPCVSRIILEVFHKKPMRGVGDLQDPKFCVAAGAAMLAKSGVKLIFKPEPPVPDAVKKYKYFDHLDDNVYLQIGLNGQPQKLLALLKGLKGEALLTRHEIGHVFTVADGAGSFDLAVYMGNKYLNTAHFDVLSDGRPIILIDLEVKPDGQLLVHARQHGGDWNDTKPIWLHS